MNLVGGASAAGITVVVGLALLLFPLGDGWVRRSYDFLFAFGNPPKLDEVVVIDMDDVSYHDLNQKLREPWDRELHAELLRLLETNRSRLVVLDTTLAEASSAKADLALSNAIAALRGRVVVAADEGRLDQPGVLGAQPIPPTPVLRAAVGTNWGIAGYKRDPDFIVRRHYGGTEGKPSVPWIAAALANAPITTDGSKRDAERWFRYYGPSETMPRLSYRDVTNQAQGYFAGKCVFIGGKPSTVFKGQEGDQFMTPHTRWSGRWISGVELNATMFLNLVRGDWLSRTERPIEALVVAVAGLLIGFGMAQVRPLLAAGVAAVVFAGVLSGAVYLFWSRNLWFPWLVIAGGQVPVALAWSVFAFTRRLTLEKRELETRLAHTPASEGTARSAAVTELDPARTADLKGVTIPDHDLIQCVGDGNYGEVWIARTAIGSYRAVKIVRRGSLPGTGPYEREFDGMKRYMPISTKHPNLLPIHHVGRPEGGGYFYYIMDLADDAERGERIDPEHYVALDLRKELQRRERFSVADAVALVLPLVSALEYLHGEQLIHRDIKPSNVIFVGGQPKLADIGLVTAARQGAEKASYIGTEGYIPPEGPGAPSGDLYSLGKVLYEACMGAAVDDYPTLPKALVDGPESAGIFQINEVITKACNKDRSLRYQCAAEMRADLEALRDKLGSKPAS